MDYNRRRKKLNVIKILKALTVSLTIAATSLISACNKAPEPIDYGIEIGYGRVNEKLIYKKATPGTTEDWANAVAIANTPEVFFLKKNPAYLNFPSEGLTDLKLTIEITKRDSTKLTLSRFWANWDGKPRDLEIASNIYGIEKCELRGIAKDPYREFSFSYIWKTAKKNDE